MSEGLFLSVSGKTYRLLIVELPYKYREMDFGFEKKTFRLIRKHNEICKRNHMSINLTRSSTQFFGARIKLVALNK